MKRLITKLINFLFPWVWHDAYVTGYVAGADFGYREACHIERVRWELARGKR